VIIGEDLDYRNMDNEWQTGTRQDGDGYHFTASKNRVLWAFGWIRCDAEEYARSAAWTLGQQAECARVLEVGR
jgi:hypothetical protein